MKRGGRMNLMILLIGSVLVSGIMVGVGLWLYKSTGAIQLDLSRPGYEREDPEVVAGEREWDFSVTGEVDGEVIDGFLEELEGKMEVVQGMGAFSERSLSDEALGI